MNQNNSGDQNRKDSMGCIGAIILAIVVLSMLYLSYWMFKTSDNFFVFLIKYFLIYIVLAISIIVFFAVIVAVMTGLLAVGNYFSKKSATKISKGNEEIYKKVEDDLQGAGVVAPFIFYVLFFLLYVFASYLYNIRMSDALLISIPVILISVYISMLVKAKELHVSLFYRLKSVFMPYVIIGTLSAIFLFYASYSIGYIHVRASIFMGLNENSMFGLGKIYLTVFNQKPWDLDYNGLLDSVLIGGGITVIIVWLAPLVVKKDWKNGILFALALASPFFMPPLMSKIELNISFVNKYFEIVPAPITSLLLIQLIKYPFDMFKKKFGAVQCQCCFGLIDRTDVYCKHCGCTQLGKGTG